MAQAARRRRWPAFAIGGLILLVLIWIGGWFVASRLADAAIARYLLTPIRGYAISCPDYAVGGFPLRVDIRCPQAHVSTTDHNIAVAVSGVSASAPLYLPGHADGSAEGPLKVDILDRGLAVTVTWSRMNATGAVWLDGFDGGTLNFEGLRVAIGKAIVIAAGNLLVAKDGLLNGSILFSYNGTDALADLMETLRPGTRSRYAEAVKAVDLLSRPVNTPDGPMRQTSLTFADGVIWLAFLPLPIDPIPPLKF